MTYRTGKPILQEVVKQIGVISEAWQKPAIEDNGRGVRLIKGKGAAGETIYGIRTRPTGKGIEWNFARRIAQERALVAKFEKEIDAKLGTGEGQKLTKKVGAYAGRVFPKLTAMQLQQLQRLVDAMPPPGFREMEPVQGRARWHGDFKFETDELKKEVLDDLKTTFQARMDKAQKTEAMDSQYKKDRPRTDIIVNRTNLREMSDEEAYSELLSIARSNHVVARNLAVLLVQDAIGSVDVKVSGRHNFVALRGDMPSTLGCVLSVDGDIYRISYSNETAIRSIVYFQKSEQYTAALDDTDSRIIEELTLRISYEDLEKTQAAGLTIEGTPRVQVDAWQ
jgi:hypothetical protein